MPLPNRDYVGRFAPSPSGPLHFGSLVCALASFLDAKRNGGVWRVRIEDIDPPREDPKHSATILAQLVNHGLQWDGEVVYQSQFLKDYQRVLDRLQTRQLTYACQCNRKRITQLGGVYDGHCDALDLADSDRAIRLRVRQAIAPCTITIDDQVMGHHFQDLLREVGDFVLRRRDGLYSYQLASVIDDHRQGITHIVRGSDLLSSTPRQRYLQQCLGYSAPDYAHLPLAVDLHGNKLSKQNHAAPLNHAAPSKTLWQALAWLQQDPPKALSGAPVEAVIAWATAHWSLGRVPNVPQQPSPTDT
jgi:glutamyl-Q tRNA(Asp) synthetase